MLLASLMFLNEKKYYLQKKVNITKVPDNTEVVDSP